MGKGDGPYKNKCKDPSHPSHYPSHKFPNGAKCEKDSQCASGDCHKGDGPFKNICKDHKSNGQSCSKDADCASGDCHKGAGDYQNKCKDPTWSNTGVTLESCSSDENQDIQVMFNKQYTHNIKFTGFATTVSRATAVLMPR